MILQERRENLNVEFWVVINFRVFEGVNAEDALHADLVVNEEQVEQRSSLLEKLVRLFIDPVLLR